MAAGLAVFAVACSGQPDSAPTPITSTDEAVEICTPVDAGAALCPPAQPSYAKDIVPLLNTYCNDCHSPGSALWPLVGYENVRDWAYSIMLDVDGCHMPPLDGGMPLPSASQRAVIAEWIACGANNN